MAIAKAGAVDQQIASFSELLRNEARSLDLLRNIEETVDTLAWARRRFDSDTELVASTVDRINECEHIMVRLDADGVACAALDDAQKAVESIHRKFCDKRDAARSAPELRADDGVVEAYEAAIEAAAVLHDAINAVRWCIMEHDADIERNDPRKSYGNAELELLFSDLRAS